MKNKAFIKLEPHIGKTVDCVERDNRVALITRDVETEEEVLLHDETYDPENPYLYNNLHSHVGHDINCAIYAGEEISIECMDCYAVLYSQNKYNDELD